MNWLESAQSKLVDTVAEISWSVQQFWMFLLREVWPVKGRKYFELRIDQIKDIAVDKRNGRSVQLIYVPLLLSLILTTVQCIYYEPKFMLITFDYFGFNNLPMDLKFFRGVVNIATYAFYQNIYFGLRKDGTFFKYSKILTDDDRKLVLDSNYDFWRLIRWTLNVYQVFVVGFELGMLLCYLQLCVALAGHTFDQLYHWPLAYLSMSIGFFVHFSTCLLICVGGLCGCIAVFLIKVIFEHFNIQKRRFLQHPIDGLTPLRLLRYRHYNTKCMMAQFELSHMYGVTLLAFLWTNVPLNVSVFALIALNKIPNAIIFFIGMVSCLSQVTVMVFFHFVAGMITNKIHRPYKTIHSQFVRYRRSTLSSHVRVATNIQAFLVKKRYGVTYHQFRMNFGLVSMSTFFKFVFVYMEMLIFGLNMYLN